MYCSKCGSELPPGASFCAQCGSRVWQQPDGPNQAAQPQQQSNPNPYSAAPYSAGQNEVSSRFSPPRPGNPNPFGGMPGGMGQNHSYAPSVSQVEDSGYTRIFGYQRAIVILNVILDVIFVFFMWWLYVKIENRSYFGYYDDVLAFLMIIIIVWIMVSVYQNYQEAKTKIEVGPNGISGRGRSGNVLGWLRLGPTKDIMISYKDMDDVQTSMTKQDMSINNINGDIKIFASGTWFYFYVENAKEAFDLIRQRWQAARR